jgi:hypothetical protein
VGFQGRQRAAQVRDPFGTFDRQGLGDLGTAPPALQLRAQRLGAVLGGGGRLFDVGREPVQAVRVEPGSDQVRDGDEPRPGVRPGPSDVAPRVGQPAAVEGAADGAAVCAARPSGLAQRQRRTGVLLFGGHGENLGR